VEDRKRHKQDEHYNNYPVDRISSDGSIEEIRSSELRVGDIIKINHDQEIPADCIVLKGPSGGDGTCRMNTSSLDGENAPKVRRAFGRTHDMKVQELAKLEACIECKENDKELRGFTGRIIVGEDSPMPVSDDNFLFRAAFLANTLYVYAIVIFAGNDTTLMLNRSHTPYKFSTFERILNNCVGFLLVSNFTLCFSLSVCAAGSFIYPARFPKLDQGDNLYQF